ncbi:MAG: hypothetical protein QW327_05365 [Candidatus Odinarchaeota archaeon]
MYDEIYRAWMAAKVKNDGKVESEIKNKIIEYLKSLQSALEAKTPIVKKICERKIANLKLLVEYFEEETNHKSRVESTKLDRETVNLNPEDNSRKHLESESHEPKYLIIRLLQSIPTIVGSDLQNYGPFNAEDVATLPVKNALALIKRNAAVEIMWGRKYENGKNG